MPQPSSGYGPRKLFGRSFHHGNDFSAPENSPVYVNKPITVTSVKKEGGYGNTVRGTDAQGNEYILGHLNSVPEGVKPGATIQPGQPIAYTGNTGDSTGAHLHYEVRKNGKPFDPKNVDSSTGKPFTDNMSFESNGTGLINSTPRPDKNKRPGTEFPPKSSPGQVTAPGAAQQPSSKPNQGNRPPKITNFRTSINPVLKYDDDTSN